MRILVLSQWFTPEPNFILSMVLGLKDRGHEVEVLTGFPNYPGGKVYEGYKIRLWQREVMSGLPVIRVPLYPSHSSSKVGRVLNYLSYAVSAIVIGSFLIGKYDVIYVYHPPVTVSLPALWYSFFRRIPFVYHIQDMWPDTLRASGMIDNNYILSLIGRWCKYVYNKASRLIVISPGFKRILCERGVPEEKISIIYNWCDGAIKSVPRNGILVQRYGLAGKFNVLFAGTMGKAQSLEYVLEAATLVKEECPEIQYVFVGGGIQLDKLKEMKKKLKLKNVIFIDRRPMAEIAEILALADVLLVHLKKDPLFDITIPGKTQAYMAAGKPLLMGVKGDASDLVRMSGSGEVCEPENPESIAAMTKKMFNMSNEDLEEMGKNGKTFYHNKLSIEIALNNFEEIFESARGL